MNNENVKININKKTYEELEVISEGTMQHLQATNPYLYCGNRARVLQNLAKCDIHKCENVPCIIYFNSTRAHKTNNTRHGVDEIANIK